MKLYRTTKVSPSGHEYVRYSASKHQYAGTKGALNGMYTAWYHNWKVILDEVEIPEDTWVRVEEA